MRIDWLDKLRNYLQVVAFCLAIAAIQYAFHVDRPYEIPLVYSVAIGTGTWALIDCGRHFIPSARETGWPLGASGIALTVAGIIGGYFFGTLVGDRWFGWSSWESGPARAELRTSIMITLLAGVSGSYYFYSLNKSAYLERKMREARRHASEAQLKLLESQLEPHMLFNTLANLRVLIGADPPRAQRMLDHMIAYLRATLNASRAATHTLEAEFDRLRDYLELMAVRMGPRLAYTLELPPELAQLQVPTLLLQPLVENSIQHGLEPKVEGGRITVSARLEAGVLTLTVSDTGIGTARAAVKGSGFGMTQVRERLATLYGAAAALEFSAEEGRGAITTTHLPVAA
ncbi:sensor histidine kinase [Caenimonas terrae]|uniref:histidine kinase n=1 Tax=Caenimonas terrae TaxID=696074 RepID=A0ABW0NF27_9BURK